MTTTPRDAADLLRDPRIDLNPAFINCMHTAGQRAFYLSLAEEYPAAVTDHRDWAPEETRLFISLPGRVCVAMRFATDALFEVAA